MATRNDCIAFCRYYKGEQECPNPDINGIWYIEKVWVTKMVDASSGNEDARKFIEDLLNDYIEAGLTEFEMYDDVPVSLKATIFNRYMKYNEMVTLDDFKRYYTQVYRRS